MAACHGCVSRVDVRPAWSARLTQPWHTFHTLRRSGRKIPLWRPLMGRNPSSLLAALVSLAMLLSAAAAAPAQSPLAEVMASAPNRFNPLAGPSDPLPPLEKLLGADQQFWVKVGPPDASLSVSLVEPPDKSRPPRGTILVLHGILARSATMLPGGQHVGQGGLSRRAGRSRGHGRSTGQYLTYGIQEAKDLSQVIDDLAAAEPAGRPLGVYGISYGATTAIHLAGGDRRVRAVVAVEPFAAAREEVPHFGRVMVPGIGLLSEQGYQEAARRGGPDRPFRSRRGRRRQGHPPDHGPSAHRPRHERLDRAAPPRANSCTAPPRSTASWSRFPGGVTWSYGSIPAGKWRPRPGSGLTAGWFLPAGRAAY